MNHTSIKMLCFAGLVSLAACTKEEGKDPLSTPINSFKNIKLGNVNNTNYGSFINLKNGSVYFLNQAPKGIDNQSDVDLAFWYNTINHGDPYLGAPAEVQSNSYDGPIFSSSPNGVNFWTTLHNTGFSTAYQVSVGTFDNIDNYQELKDAVEDIYGNYEYNVRSEKIYKFKTWDNKIGLLRINTISGNGQVAATMDIDIKVQQ